MPFHFNSLLVMTHSIVEKVNDLELKFLQAQSDSLLVDIHSTTSSPIKTVPSLVEPQIITVNPLKV